MKRKWKLILTTVLVLSVAGVLLSQRTQGLEAETLNVAPRTIASTVTEEGEVVSKVQRPIYPASGGKVVTLNATEGQQVKAGDLLVALDTKELELQLQQLNAEKELTRQDKLAVEQARRQYNIAQKDYQRSQQLYQQGAVTRTELEQVENALESARANLEQRKQYYQGKTESLKAQIDLLKLKLDQMNITAPVDGIIADLSVKEGAMVSPAAPLMTVFQESNYQVETFVLAEEINNLAAGMTVQLIQDNQDKDIRFEGSIEKIAPSAIQKQSALGLSEKRVKVTLTPDTPAGLELRPGYSLDVMFTLNKKTDKLAVPKTALFPYQKGKAIWLIKNGTATVQSVTTGFENDRDIVIEEGLSTGDVILLNPQLEGLQEGKEIIPVEK